MAGFERDARRAVRARRAGVGARRRLRRGRARAPLGAAPRRGAHGRHRPRGGVDPGRLGASARRPNLEYRVMPAENLPVRRGRVRAGQRDRGARARARPRAHAGRDGALREPPPARVGAARAAVADAEHGARRLLARPRQHAGPPQPLVQALVRARCCPATGRSSRCARRSPGRCCLSASRTSPRGRAAPTGRGARSYGRGARILSIGIASTGLLTFAYFSIASHVLGEAQAKRVDLLWSVMFVIISVIYRPIEQLLSRTIAGRRARGHAQHTAARADADPGQLRAAVPGARARRSKNSCSNVFDHDEALYWILVVGTLAYAASYFARGWLAGHERFGLFGGLVLMESLSRLCFALAVARRHRQRRDGGRARHRRGAVRLAGRRAGGVRAPRRPMPDRAGRADHGRRGRRGARRARHRGRAGDGRPRRPLAAPRRRLRGLGLGDHARRADAAERGGADRRRDREGRRAGRHRLQRAADRARAAAALPGDPDLAAAPPHRPRGDGRARRVRARDPRHGARDRRVRRGGRARRCWRSARS